MTTDILVKQVDPQAWKEIAERAHVTVFEEIWDKELERIDFALIMTLKETDTMISYTTAQKVDQHTVYLQYGGALPQFQGTPLSFLSFKEMLSHLKKDFKKIVTLVENDNYPMLRFYFKVFFKVTGIRYFKNHIYLEVSYEPIN